MRDQAVVQKVGNRSGLSGTRRSTSAVQRPSKRSQKSDLAERLRNLSGYFPSLLKVALAVGLGVMLFLGYRAAAAASFFQIRQVEVQGASRVSGDEVQALVRREASKTGVWNADLNMLSEKIERLPWVRNAVVSRVLPDGVRVRIAERIPVAVVRTAAGRFRWVDEESVPLGEMSPADHMPAFFLRGLSEEDTEIARRENIDRVRMFLALQGESEAAGLSERISEVNLMDVKDVRVQLAGNDSQIELRLGSQETNKRLQEGLRVLDQQRQLPRGRFISYIDLSYGKRVVGFISGAHVSAGTDEAESAIAAQQSSGQTPIRETSQKEATKRPDKTTRPNEKGRADSTPGAER